jgi:hypothetical protein
MAKWIVLLVVVLVVGGIVFSVVSKVAGVFDSEGFEAINDAFDRLDEGVNVPPQPEIAKVPSPYKGVRALAVALNEGGLHCNKIVADHADEYVATGSCQAAGTHVQINIFFEATSLNAVEDQMTTGAFTFVHDANWFVITLDPTARKVHKILGGRLSLAK